MRYRLLGNLTIERDDGVAIEIAAPRRRALLAILLLQRGGAVSRERLIELLWGADAPDTAAESLFAHISRLRGDIGRDSIRSVPGGYVLPLGDEQLDIARFERDVAAARLASKDGRWLDASAALRAAEAHWRGAALAEFADEPFAQPEISRLEQLRGAALEDLMDADLALNRHAELVPELEKLVQLHPLRERLWAQLMLALYRSGRQSDALDRYQRLRRVLVDDLGIEPSPEVQALQGRILRHDPALAAPLRGAGGAPTAAAGDATDPTAGAARQHDGNRRSTSFLTGVSIGWIASLTIIVVAVIIGAALVQGGGPSATVGPSGQASSAAPVVTPVAVAPTPHMVDELLFAASWPRGEDLSCDAIETRLLHVDAAGGNPARITRGGDVFELAGTWSPDGTRIAFIGNRQDDTSMFVMNADGTGLRDLLPSRPPDRIPGRDGFLNWTFPLFRPTWTADGARIVFTYAQGGVWSVAPDGSELQQLIADPVFNADDFSYSFRAAATIPDGRISVEVSEPDASGVRRVTLYVASGDGSQFARLPGLPDDVLVEGTTWADDGRLAFRGITFVSEEQPPITNLYVVDSPGGSPRVLAGTEGISGPPAWSPDGSRLAFTANGDLFTIGADGSALDAVVHDPGATACGASWVRMDAALLPAPASTPAPGASAPVSAFHRGFLDPGTYESTVFEPAMQFTLGTGWSGNRNDVDSLRIDHGWATDSGFDGYVAVGRVQVVLTSPCPWGEGRLIGPTAAEFIDYLRAHEADPGLDVADPTPVIYGGVTGLAVDVLAARPLTEEQCPGLPPPFLAQHPLFEVGGRTIAIRKGDRLRVVSLDVGDGPAVTFLLISPTQDFESFTDVTPEAFGRFLDAAQPILDSLAFR